jgi:PAS domain S-box-containing protein
MPVTVTVTTPEGKLVSSNHAIGDMLGYTPQEFAAINMSDLYVDPGERRRMIAILQEKGKVRDLEVKFRRKDGTIIFALINIEWITIGGQRLILSTGRDITERKAAEERLRESEDLFRHVSSTTSDIAYSCVGTREGGYAIQWMSGAVKDITGYTIEELKARRCWGTIVIEEDAALFREHIANLGPGVSATCELRIRAKNGAVVWVVSHVKCAIDPDDSAKLRLYGALVDITERKVVEEALRESEERYRIQFEQTIDALFLADTQTGIILDCNRAAIELMGREKSEMVGQHQRMLHPPEEWDKKFSKSFTQHISGETVAETKVIKKSGEIRDVAIKASTFDLKGKKVILAIFHDITERKKAEEALKDSEEMFRKVFRESPIGMMLFDENGKLADINSACVEILGISDVKKTLNMDLFDDPNLPEMIKRTVKAGERVRHEIEYNFEKVKESHYYKTSKSGRIELDVIIVPVSFGKKKTRGYLAHMQDITRRKHAEEDLRKTYFQLKEAQDEFIQSEKMAALGRFASGIAHEVKNPLGVILGGVELLDRKLKKADADTKTALAKIKESVLRANNILLDLLQYAKPSKKKFESIELKEIISTVAPLIKFKISPNTVISLELAKERICCNADNNQMQQVILNVVLNAVEAMPEGGIVTIRTYTSKPSELFPGKKACVIEVIDTGTGISKEDMTKVSEPFFTTKIGRKGTGLGLFMARTMIANHGGKLLIESEKGKGTSVKIVLPLAKTKKETEDEEDTGDR